MLKGQAKDVTEGTTMLEAERLSQQKVLDARSAGLETEERRLEEVRCAFISFHPIDRNDRGAARFIAYLSFRTPFLKIVFIRLQGGLQSLGIYSKSFNIFAILNVFSWECFVVF